MTSAAGMDEHRLVSSSNLKSLTLSPPVSLFQIVEDRYGNNPAIHRCFSLARAFHADRLGVEDIEPKGIILEEIQDLQELRQGFETGPTLRLSFWNERSNLDH